MEQGIYASTIVIITLIILGIFISLLTGLLLVPMVSTPKNVRSEILDKMRLKKGEIMLDLGSGNGSFLIEAAEKYGIMGIGYEISPVGIILARIIKTFKLGFKNDIAIVPSNFLSKTPLPIADKIYCYLNTNAMETIQEKLKNEDLDESTQVFSYKYPFPNIEPNQKLELSDNKYLFMYKGNKFTN